MLGKKLEKMTKDIQTLLAENGFDDFLIFGSGEGGGITAGAGSQVRLFETIMEAMEGDATTARILYHSVMSYVEENNLSRCAVNEGAAAYVAGRLGLFYWLTGRKGGIVKDMGWRNVGITSRGRRYHETSTDDSSGIVDGSPGDGSRC